MDESNTEFCERCGQLVSAVFKFLEHSYASMLYPNGVCYDCQSIMHPEMRLKLKIKDTDENLGSTEFDSTNDTGDK